MIGKIYNWNKKYLISILYHPSPRVIGVHRTIDEMINDLRNVFREYIRIKNQCQY